MSNHSSNEILPVAVFASLCFVWGSTWLAIKVGLGYLPPLTFAGLRFVIASAILLVYSITRRLQFPTDRLSWKIMLFLALTQITLPYALVFWGEQYLTAGLTSLLFATLPFFVALYAHFVIPSERITVWKIVGMLVSFLGVAIIFSGELVTASYSFLGGVAVIASAASAACANVVGKKYSDVINPTFNVVVQNGIGAIILTIVGITLERGFPVTLNMESLFSIFYLAAAGSAFGFVALYWLFTKMEVTKISLFTFITPIVAVLLGWLLLGERVDLTVALGGSLILTGVILVNRTPAASRNASH